MVCSNAFGIQHLEEYKPPNVCFSKSRPHKDIWTTFWEIIVVWVEPLVHIFSLGCSDSVTQMRINGRVL